MWHVIRVTAYDPTTDPPKITRFTTESNSLVICLCEMVGRIQLEIDGQESRPPVPFQSCMAFAIEATSTLSSEQAVTRDTEAEHILLRMKASLGVYLSSLASRLVDGTKETSNGSSPK